MTQDPPPVIADYVTARIQTSSFGKTTINGRAHIARIADPKGFSMHDDGFFYQSSAILRLNSHESAGLVRAIALISDETMDIARGIATSLAESSSDPQRAAHIATSRAITEYCANVHTTQRDLSVDCAYLRELRFQDTGVSAFTITGECTMQSHMAPIMSVDTEIELPTAEAGRYVEYVPPPQQSLIVRSPDGTEWISYGQAMTFISDGTQWFAIDALGRKYSH